MDKVELRDRIFIWDFSKRVFRGLHSYVPFYFAMRSPMLYVQYQQGVQDSIIIFEVSRSILKDQGVVFTAGNASNQQLSKFANEVVDIIPATVRSRSCRRRYRPDGPYGTNTNRSDFYGDIFFLDQLNWDVINDRWFMDAERKRIKHAEVLVPDLVPLGRIHGIFVSKQVLVQAVNTVIAACGLAGRIPFATYKPEMFFS